MENPLARKKPTKTIWVTREGARIRVKDMGDIHLLNTLRMIWRNAVRVKHAHDMEYLRCAPPTADIAALCFERESEMVWDSPPQRYLLPIWDTMWREAEKRKLDLTELADKLEEWTNMSRVEDRVEV